MTSKLKEVRTKRIQEISQEIVPAPYVLKREDPRFTFKNLFIEYARFHAD
jgi:hypothetical protein